MLLDCPPVGPCREVEGNCGDLASVFADTPVPPYFPDGLSTYECHTFPDDDRPLDSFVVGLISIAVALPVTLFLTSCFESACASSSACCVHLFVRTCADALLSHAVANDSEAPESWLFYGGVVKLLCGLKSHRLWHYTGLEGQPPRFVRWYCRSVDAPKPETIINLWHSLRCYLTGATPPWLEEWQEWQAEQEEEGVSAEDAHKSSASNCEGDRVHSDVASVATDESTAALRRSKRMLTAFGLSGIYVTWAVFAWFIFVRALTRVLRPLWAACVPDAHATLMLRLASSQTYGSLIYQLLGAEQQDSFARGWGVSYGMGAATEWKEILKEALKGLIILAILERLHLTRPVNWLEEVRASAYEEAPAACSGGVDTVHPYAARRLLQRTSATLPGKEAGVVAADAPFLFLQGTHCRLIKCWRRRTQGTNTHCSMPVLLQQCSLKRACVPARRACGTAAAALARRTCRATMTTTGWPAACPAVGPSGRSLYQYVRTTSLRQAVRCCAFSSGPALGDPYRHDGRGGRCRCRTSVRACVKHAGCARAGLQVAFSDRPRSQRD
jgi:hypothetical protein